MIPWEEIRIYLPQYLSAESTKILFEELEQFPENIDKRLYTINLYEQDAILFQGDGIKDMPLVSLPEPTIYSAPAMLLSNTCDNDPRKGRYIKPNLIYAPIVILRKLIDVLTEEGVEKAKIESLIVSIRKQHVTQIFYLPSGYGIEEESIVFFDKINSCNNFLEGKELRDIRLFCLSDYGFYLFLFKLSVHFTRIQAKVDRNKGIIN
jgi:hypothetical protein